MTDQPFSKKTVNILGKSMAYHEHGEGMPVLFLHGNPTSSCLWRDVIPELHGYSTTRCYSFSIHRGGTGRDRQAPNRRRLSRWPSFHPPPGCRPPLSDLCDARQLRQSSDDVAAWRYHRDRHSAGRRHGEEAEAHLSDARGRHDAGNREIMHTTFRKGCHSHEAYHHRLAKRSTRPNETAAILPFWRNWKIVEVLWMGGPLSHRFQTLR